jgi:methionyl-tRNA formyltransferase
MGERIRVHGATVIEALGAPGEVLDDALAIACSTGAIRPSLVQRAGRGVMTPQELLRGFPIPPGTILA